MARLRVVLKGRKAVLSDSLPLPIFDEVDLGRSYFPGRGLSYSVLIHIVVFVGLFFLSLYRSYPAPPLLIDQISFVHPRLPKVVAYLPLLEPGGQFVRFPEPKEKPARKKTPVKKASKKGLSYPGPQLIVSNVPKPTNEIQTILQPDLEKPPILIPPLDLPNIVQVADLMPVIPKIPEPPPPPKEPQPEPPKPVKEPEVQPEVKTPEPPMVLPDLKLAPPTRLQEPKLMLPPSIPPVLQAKSAEDPLKMELPGQIKAPPPPPEPKPSAPPQKAEEQSKAPPGPRLNEKPKAVPAAESNAPEGKKNLLSLTPMPASPKEPVDVPYGEARGRFVISPEPNLAVSEKEAGAKSGLPSKTLAVVQEPASNGNAAAVTEAGDSASGNAKAADENLSRPGGNGESAAGDARPESSSGSGKAQGSGKKPFAGITIVGGDFSPGEDSDNARIRRARRPLQTAYGLSIISTEDSGGGLPFVGVFSNEQIYTVYLDMRQSEMEQDPSWTLEFAVIQGAAAQTNNPGNQNRQQQGLILPFPAEKERPVFPEDLVRRNINKMIIVYAVINAAGKMEQITIKQSPDIQFNEPVIQSLSKWTFRPAQLNGETVATKVLMGIPLWMPE